MKEKPLFHGSDIEQTAAWYGIPKESIISFSANVNPLGISPALKEKLVNNVEQISTYPDRDYMALRTALARYTGAPLEHILIGNGATEFISLLIGTCRPQKAVLVNPTYSEYGREIELAGGRLESFQLNMEQEFRLDPKKLCQALDSSVDLLILCNPNNPTGTAVHTDDLRIILEDCLKKQILVMIDETYVEFAEEMADITAVKLTEEYDNLFVLRGVSKFFCAPGLRLGYAITGNQTLRENILSVQNPWTVHTLAAVCAGSMFEDSPYIQRTRKFIHEERNRMKEKLSRISGLHMYPASANFILLRILKEGVTSGDVFDAAIQRGLMIRDCASFPGLGTDHIRFCFARPEENDRLIQVLQDTLSEN